MIEERNQWSIQIESEVKNEEALVNRASYLAATKSSNVSKVEIIEENDLNSYDWLLELPETGKSEKEINFLLSAFFYKKRYFFSKK